MGGQQSVRATHFQRHEEASEQRQEEVTEEHHISISNKMVERLVEDATLGAAAVEHIPIPRGDYKEKVYIEKLKCLDETHSEKTGLTISDLNNVVRRIECRTANMAPPEPVCRDFRDRVVDCYNTYSLPEHNVKCWDTVAEFTSCVEAAGRTRLAARSVREERETARRARHMRRAREHELKDLAPRD